MARGYDQITAKQHYIVRHIPRSCNIWRSMVIVTWSGKRTDVQTYVQTDGGELESIPLSLVTAHFGQGHTMSYKYIMLCATLGCSCNFSTSKHQENIDQPEMWFLTFYSVMSAHLLVKYTSLFNTTVSECFMWIFITSYLLMVEQKVILQWSIAFHCISRSRILLR